MQEKKKIKVLLVDDEEIFARTLSERLSSNNIVADATFSGKEALDFIGKNEPDIMILDLKMPGIDGMEVLRRVKKKYPNTQTIILSGYGTDSDKNEAFRLGVSDFLTKPTDINTLKEKIREAFAAPKGQDSLFSYGSFVPILKRHFQNEGISLGENALGIKCFCRDDNQDQLGYLLMKTSKSGGWFDLNAYGAYPAGRSIESLLPPSHHIPDLQKNPWIIVFHATHVGCDSQYTLGVTERYGMRQPSSSCGLIASILQRYHDRQKSKKLSIFKDFEMAETEKALLPYLEEITSLPYPMASAAEKLFELGYGIFDALLRNSCGRHFYVGGINIDYDAAHPENNLFSPKTLVVYEGVAKRELKIQ